MSPRWRPLGRAHDRGEDAAVALAALLGPDAIEVSPRRLRLGEVWCQTLAVVGYPREVGLGWLEPLQTYPGPIDVAVHVDPVPPKVAADRLRRQLARLESSQNLDADRGRLEDFGADAAVEDARDLARRLARGQGRLYRVGLYVTVRGHSEAELDEHVGQVRALLSSMLLDARPATFRALGGWLSTLPFGLDALGVRRTFDTQALAAAFPFASAELPDARGVLYGRVVQTGGLAFWDRFDTQRLDNHNAVILARSGAGKSYLAKLELLRSLYRGIQGWVIDPEREYERLSEAVGGTYLRLGAPGVRLNPLDLPPPDPDGDPGEDAFDRATMFVHTLVEVLLGEPLDPAATAALDRAAVDAYKHVGITPDRRTHTRPAPLLRDLAAALDADADPAARMLAARLTPYARGSYRRLFDGPTTTHPRGHLVIFSLKELPAELATLGTLLALDAIWKQVADPTRSLPGGAVRRLVVVDEAWTLMQHPAGAGFLERLARSARKHHAGLTVVTQEAGDLLESRLGQAVLHNADTSLLLGQTRQAIDLLADTFHLSDGEQGFLLTAQKGEGLLAAPGHRVAFHALASPTEHQLITTDPAELQRTA